MADWHSSVIQVPSLNKVKTRQTLNWYTIFNRSQLSQHIKLSVLENRIIIMKINDSTVYCI